MMKQVACTCSLALFAVCILPATHAAAEEDRPPGKTITFRYTRGGPIVLENAEFVLQFDSRMRAEITHITPKGKHSILRTTDADESAVPPQYVKVNGREVHDFIIDYEDFHSLETINTVHGPGKRLRLWGTAKTKGGVLLKKTVAVEVYERYASAALFHTEYTNLGSSPLTVDTCYEVTWRFDPKNLWALHPRRWKPGEDFVFKVEPGMNYDRENCAFKPERYGQADHGGGLPAVSFWNGATGLTLGYLSPTMKVVRFILRHQGEFVSVGIERDIGIGPEKRALAPGGVFKTLPTFIAVHRGDYYDGIRVMSRLHQDVGLAFRNPPMADLTAPAWSNRGNGSKWSKESILQWLPVLKQFGIKWIHMGDGWVDNLGDYGTSDKFDSPEDLRAFLDRLHGEGFRVTVFMSDLVIYPEARVVREHPEYFVKNEDGSFLRARSFGHDCYVLCPSYAPSRAFMRGVCEKLAGEYGFDGVKDDGHKVPSPCYNPVHRHPYPEQSVEDYPLLIKEVYETFARLKPESFVIAFCFDGVVPYFYHHHHTTRPWPNADQKSEQQARWKQKLFKAIFGPRRVLLDDHSDVKYLSGARGTWYLGPISGLAMGSVLETAIAPGYGYQSHGYDKIFAAYHREKLPEGGEYLNLYDVTHDKPECHVVRKGDSIYYGFFAEAHEGPLELRGLEDGSRYRVVDYLRGVEYPDLVAEDTTGRLEVGFDSYLLLRLQKR
jgi:alpha-galactosidase